MPATQTVTVTATRSTPPVPTGAPVFKGRRIATSAPQIASASARAQLSPEKSKELARKQLALRRAHQRQ